MNLKPPTVSFFFILSLLLLVSSVSHGRKDLEAYWEKKMKGLPMPELIKDLSDTDRDLFVRDFQMKPNAIIYHSHAENNNCHEKNLLSAKKIEAEEKKKEEDKLAQ